MTVKVLAIDDSRTIRSLVQKVMEDAGFDCVCAEDGVDGIARFAEVSPDVVITDINMPNMDGYGVISSIRGGEVNQSVPILVLTTESDDTIVSVVRRVTGARG
jgi:two-component system chemotaxis response regulator CheY